MHFSIWGPDRTSIDSHADIRALPPTDQQNLQACSMSKHANPTHTNLIGSPERTVLEAYRSFASSLLTDCSSSGFFGSFASQSL